MLGNIAECLHSYLARLAEVFALMKAGAAQACPEPALHRTTSGLREKPSIVRFAARQRSVAMALLSIARDPVSAHGPLEWLWPFKGELMIAAPKNMFGSNMFDLLVDDIGISRSSTLLEVTARTICSWRQGITPVPRMAVLALYWESQWGRSQVATSHHNEITELRGYVEALRLELSRLANYVQFLEQDAPRSANAGRFLPSVALTTVPDGRLHLVPPRYQR